MNDGGMRPGSGPKLTTFPYKLFFSVKLILPLHPSLQVLTQKLGRSKAALQETLLRLSRSNLQKAGQVHDYLSLHLYRCLCLFLLSSLSLVFFFLSSSLSSIILFLKRAITTWLCKQNVFGSFSFSPTAKSNAIYLLYSWYSSQ